MAAFLPFSTRLNSFRPIDKEKRPVHPGPSRFRLWELLLNSLNLDKRNFPQGSVFVVRFCGVRKYLS